MIPLTHCNYKLFYTLCACAGPGVVPGYDNVTTVQGLIVPPYKLLIGPLYQDIWTSPKYPNASTDWVNTPHHCHDPAIGGSGCLFNIFDDPTETTDLAGLPAYTEVVTTMRARMTEIQATVFTPDRGTDDGTACAAAMGRYGGFWGPFLE